MPSPEAILIHALPHIPFDGWTMQAFARAAMDAGLPKGAEQIAFPRGAIDAVATYSRMLDAELVSSLPADFSQKRIPEKIETLLCLRVQAFQAHLEASRSARRVLLAPWQASTATALLFETVGLLWQLCDVKDSGFSWYTRRLSLAAVYTACVEFGLTDMGQDPESLQQFARRRLQQLASLQKLRKSIELRYA